VTGPFTAGRSAEQKGRGVAGLLVLHDQDFAADGVELVADERGAAERPEVVEQELGGAPALDERLDQLLHSDRKGDGVAGATEALPAQFAFGPDQEQRRHLLRAALQVFADVVGQIAGHTDADRHRRAVAVHLLPVGYVTA